MANEPNIVETIGTIDPGNGDSQAGKRPPTAEEARLLKEVMRSKAEKQALAEKLKAFDGLDADKVRNLITTAEAAKQQAEEQRIRASGDFAAFKASIAASYQQEIAALHATTEAANLQREAQEQLIRELTIGAAFTSSKFIAEEMVLPPAKARRVFGDHFDLEDGRVVAYDAPRGADGRTPLVDGTGEPMNFNQALRRLVDADPERDALLRSGHRVAGAKRDQTQQQARAIGVGIDRIAAGLAATGIRVAQDQQDAPDQPGPSLNHRNVVQHAPALLVADRDLGPTRIANAIKAGGLPKAAPPKAR